MIPLCLIIAWTLCTHKLGLYIPKIFALKMPILLDLLSRRYTILGMCQLVNLLLLHLTASRPPGHQPDDAQTSGLGTHEPPSSAESQATAIAIEVR